MKFKSLFITIGLIKWWQYLLFPFAILYDLVTRTRNYLYNIEHKASFQFDIPVVSVGNLSVGGTGKTPMVMFLIDYFMQQGKQVATLSRGYGRKTRGFKVCSEVDTAATIGDEPYTYYTRYGGRVHVCVGEDRALAIPFILAECPDTDIILMDDAYQHRAVKPLFQILLTIQKRPFWQDYVLPAGRLREARSGYKRADALIVTKSEVAFHDPYLDGVTVPWFKTYVDYGAPQLFNGSQIGERVIAVAGLADNAPFFEYISSRYILEKTFSFPDHHDFKHGDFDQAITYLQAGCSLVTTEKDFVKLKGISALDGYHCAFIPISVKFHEKQERFLSLLEESLKNAS